MSAEAATTISDEEHSRNTRLLLIVVVTAILVSVLNQTFVNVVVPDIQSDYGVSQGQVGWVITAYLLVFAVGIPLYGRISDLYSLRRTFAVGLAILALGSLFCALAPTLPLLVAGRIVQGIGAAAIPALGFAAVAKSLPPGERGTALGLLSASVGAGAAIGPVAGGLVAGLVGWHWLFVLTAVMSVGLIPGALRALPDASKAERVGFAEVLRRFDVPGGLALALGAGFALLGVTEGQVRGFGSPASWGSILLSVLFAAFFVWRTRTARIPFVSPHLFRNRAFLSTSAVGFFMMFANVGSLILSPLLLSEENGLSAAGIGLVLAPGALTVAVLSPLTGKLSDRIGPRALVRIGLVIMLVSTVAVSAFAAGAPALWVSAGLWGLGLGFAAVNSPNANAATATLSPEESGVGLGIYQMIFFLGGGFGPAVAATFLSFRSTPGTDALNPLYALDAAAYSDSFLLVSAATIMAFVASFGLKKATGKQTP
ncbi:MAG TPA: MFS transporter [Rubrobacter sp.]|nr:MFS transporter [Rubrobacter sp.]